MDSFDRYTREELLTLLRTWNDELARYQAVPAIGLDAAIEMHSLDKLRDAVIGTEARLAEVARNLGPRS